MPYPYIQSNPHYVIEHFPLGSLREVKFDLYKQLQQKGINLIIVRGDVRNKKFSNRFQTLGKVAILGVMNIKVRIFR